DQYKPIDYIDQVVRRNIYDPILTFQLSNDFQVKRLLKQYLPEDEKSAGYATLLEWNNCLYEPNISFMNSTKSRVRIGVVQWQMRLFSSFEEAIQQVEYFVDALSDYQSDFALFPEFFNAPLMALTEQGHAAHAIQLLASYTDQFINAMSNMAVSYNINIISGSMPVIEDGKVFNVAFLCRRDGTVESQKKIHITPHERSAWVIEGGDHVQTFDTDAGKIGILICYDVEFPELSRLLANEGLEILFVPFWTDTKNGYLRVRHCAQARAIENECVVAIAGSVGNLPSVDHLDIQYAQSAIFSPSDFLFPQDAIMAETTPNTEMVLFADIEMNYLKTLHNEGSVTNLKDRREDLYSQLRKAQIARSSE
ncbi:carbon-nitrogen hydrolase family protein, partial [bacterium]|nr:carbon-nitrogen hydrolase family protein [bacterium]